MASLPLNGGATTHLDGCDVKSAFHGEVIAVRHVKSHCGRFEHKTFSAFVRTVALRLVDVRLMWPNLSLCQAHTALRF